MNQHSSPYFSLYPKIKIAPDVSSFGWSVARAFLLYVAKRPQAVISLPTGKTPHAFLAALAYFKEHWFSSLVTQFFKGTALEGAPYPDTTKLYFVQMDEFLFMSFDRPHSFVSYVTSKYQSVLGIDDAHMLCMDFAQMGFDLVRARALFSSVSYDQIAQRVTLTPEQLEVLQAIDRFCTSYEASIRALGGIDLFIGGIGPDGHVAFNMPGSSVDSLTRLVQLNYQSSAAAAGTFGGMMHARGVLAVTIGLGTIMYNPRAEFWIIACGQAKADIVFASFMARNDEQFPISLLAQERLTYFLTEQAAQPFFPLSPVTSVDLVRKIEQGSKEIVGKTIVHTSPHHDDEMLAYFSYIQKLLSGNANYFAYLTSGFNAVADSYLVEQARKTGSCSDLIRQLLDKHTYQNLLSWYARAYHAQDDQELLLVESCLFAHCLQEVFSKEFFVVAAELIQYCTQKYPGQKDTVLVQQLKGRIRESEADRLWACKGVDLANVWHARCAFYHMYGGTDELVEQDVALLLDYLYRVKPDIITVALDPESTGPDTHFRVLRLLQEVLSRYEYEIEVWGYRNVWSTFRFDQATDIIFTDAASLEEMKSLFVHCFSTQKNAQFPSVLYDGPFSDLVELQQKRQWQEIKELLPSSYAYDPLVTGAVLLKKMSKQEFIQWR